MPLHTEIIQTKTITLAKSEVQTAILNFLGIGQANEINFESDGRCQVVIRKHIKEGEEK